jgi:hypothetical protein
MFRPVSWGTADGTLVVKEFVVDAWHVARFPYTVTANGADLTLDWPAPDGPWALTFHRAD